MPPKGAKEPKVEVAAKRDPRGDPSRAEALHNLGDLTDAERAMNASFIKHFEESLSKLLSDPVFEGIHALPELDVREGGPGVGFSQDAFTATMNAADAVAGYDFIGNMFMHDVRWRPVPATPVNIKGISDIIAHHYQHGVAPSRLNFVVTLAVAKGNKKVQADYGALKRASPEEPVFALLLAAASATEHEEKVRFARLMRCIRYTCQACQDERSIVRLSIDLREELRTVAHPGP